MKAGFGGCLLKGGLGGKGKGIPFIEEDRSFDWYCPKCRERNFLKRPACFKCGEEKPKGDAAPVRRAMPAPGSTQHGMVKSYNKKGFGFIMCFGHDEMDIYYTRDNVSPRLLHPDMPGEQVTFEIQKEAGRLIAKNIRPFGEERNADILNGKGGKIGGKPVGHVFGPKATGTGKEEEDRSRDWACASCGERNFMKRVECFRCKMPRATGFHEVPEENKPEPKPVQKRDFSPHAGSRAVMSSQNRSFSPHAGSRAVRDSIKASQGRSFSPHAGSRAVRDSIAASLAAADGSGSSSPRRKKKKKKRKRSSSKSEGSSSSSSRKAKKKRSKKRSHSVSSSSRARSSSSSCKMEDNSGAASSGTAAKGEASGDPEIETAKAEALQQLMKLQSVEPKDVRMTEWRALLRQWHPDKNPDRVELATAVFQFLQKGKAILDSK